MESGLTIRVRFPGGQFNATGKNGKHEWPPSPARVQQALMATARQSGTQADMDLARSTFGLDSPVIATPPAAYRTGSYQRWVPVQTNPTLDENGDFTGSSEKLADTQRKMPEPGVLIDPDREVVYVWKKSAGIDITALNQLARLVPWLGRPTSPALLSATPGADIPDMRDGDALWQPGPGAEQIAVGNTDMLKSLDREFEALVRSEQRAGFQGTTPIRQRPHQRNLVQYTKIERPTGDGVQPPNMVELNEALTGVTVVGLEGVAASPTDARALIDTLRAVTGAPIQPVFGMIGRDARLFGAIVYGSALDVSDLPVFFADGIATTRIREPGRSAIAAVSAACSTACSWTSAAPVTCDDSIGDEVTALAISQGVAIEEGGSHEFSLTPGGQHVPDRDDLTNITVRFDHLVTGPLRIGGTVLVPVDETYFDDTAHR